MKTGRNPAFWVFWSSLAALAYTYAGFPLLIALRGIFRPRPFRTTPRTPSISFIIPAHNEASVITKKLDNTVALTYPADSLEVIVASDGSDDGTIELVEAYPDPRVRLLSLPRQGKNLTLNQAVTAARGDILVFSDADTGLIPDAIQYLVAPFADPTVGGAGGEHQYSTGIGGRLGRWYWEIKRGLKRLESRAGSVTSAEGPILAIRRCLYGPLPTGVNDDLYISLQVHANHKRLVFEPRAVAYELASNAAGSAFQRKVRVITGTFHTGWRMRGLCNPMDFGFFSLQLISHKFLRRVVAFPVLGLAISSLFLGRRGRMYQFAVAIQVGIDVIAVLGYLFRRTRFGRHKTVRIPVSFYWENVAAIVALTNFLRGVQYGTWTTKRTNTNRREIAVEIEMPEVSHEDEPTVNQIPNWIEKR